MKAKTKRNRAIKRFLSKVLTVAMVLPMTVSAQGRTVSGEADYWNKIPDGLKILNDSDLKIVDGVHLLEGSTPSKDTTDGWGNGAFYFARGGIEDQQSRNYVGKDVTMLMGPAKKIIQFTGYKFYIHSAYEVGENPTNMAVTIDGVEQEPVDMHYENHTDTTYHEARVVYESGELENTTHTVTIELEEPDSMREIYFDALIYANDPHGMISFADTAEVSVKEGENLTTAIRRDGPTDQAASVKVKVKHNNTADDDFALVEQTVDFAAGEEIKNVTFPTIKDEINADDKDCVLLLEEIDNQGIVGFDSKVAVTLKDSDNLEVTFENGSGLGDITDNSVWPLQPVESRSVGEVFNLPSPFTGYRRAGYVFDGWTDGKNTYQPGDQYTMPDEDVNFDVIWKERTDGAPEPWGATPNALQMRYYHEQLSGFLCFGTNTYRDIEWGNDGATLLSDYQLNPETLDTDQWIEVFKDSGIKRALFTAKHHDGFRLWNTDEFSVAQVAPENQIDVLEELSKSCTKYNMDMALYFSPWDIYEDKGKTLTDGGTVPAGSGSGTMDGAFNNKSGDPDVYPLNDDYNKLYEKHLMEIFNNDKYGNHGDFIEAWFDGANDGGSTQLYDMREWNRIVKDANNRGTDKECINQNIGAYQQVSWPANEVGYIDPNLWSKIDLPQTPTYCDFGDLIVNHQSPTGEQWTVWEGDYSIRPGWYHHDSQDGSVKSADDIFMRYLRTVGHGGVMLLNLPPNKAGQMDQADMDNTRAFFKLVTSTFGEGKNMARGENVTITADKTREDIQTGDTIDFKAENLIDGKGGYTDYDTVTTTFEDQEGYDSYWTMADNEREGTLTVDLGEPKTFDLVELQEYIPLGQRINNYKIEVEVNGQWKSFAEGTLVGYKRFAKAPVTTAQKLRITVSSDYAVPVLNSIGVFKLPKSQEVKASLPWGLKYINDSEMTVGTKSATEKSEAWYKSGAEGTKNLLNNDYTDLAQNGYKEVTFTGSKFYLRGMKKCDSGTNLTVQIDGGEVEVVDTLSANSTDLRHPYLGEEKGMILYTSPDLAYGEHTVKIAVETKDSLDHYASVDALIYCDNENGMFEFEDIANVYVNEGEKVTVNVVRLGDSSKAVDVLVESNPGTAVHGEDFVQETKTVHFDAGESVKPVTFETVDNGKIERDSEFYLSIKPTEAIAGSYNDNLTVRISDNEAPDLIEGKTVQQSSTANDHTADMAIDKDEFTYSETEAEENPWWSADMEKENHVGEIKFQTETSGASYVITVLDAENNVVWESEPMQDADGLATVNAGGAKGQTLKITLQGTGSLKLVQVSADEAKNIALYKKTEQSSTAYEAGSERAVDGNTSAVWDSSSITCTSESEKTGWWIVDLGSTKKISCIDIYNRAEGLSWRLADYRVSVLDENKEVVWTEAKAEYPNLSRAHYPEGAKGRYVKVELEDNGANRPLCLSEVEVYALPEEDETVGYTVRVENGTGAGRFPYNAKVTVTADAPADGMKFVGWKVDGKVVSTDAKYTFYVSGNMTLEAAYAAEDAVVEETTEALLTNVITMKRADGKYDVKFVGQIVLPKGSTIEKAGLVWSSNDGEELVLNGEFKETYIRKISDTNQFSVTIKGMPEGRFLRGRIFATVENEAGEETVYSVQQVADPENIYKK